MFLAGDKLQAIDFAALASIDKLDNIGTVVRGGKEGGAGSREEEAGRRVRGRRSLVWGIGLLLSGGRQGLDHGKAAVASLF